MNPPKPFDEHVPPLRHGLGVHASPIIKDIIKSINGIKTELLGGLSEIRLMLTEKAGTEYSFVVDRGGQELKMKLRLENLL